MPLHDATEYQFATPTRRVLVREAHAPSAGVDLSEAGRQYAEHLETFLDATDLTVTPEVPTAGGAEAVTVTATVPRVDVAGSSAASVVRTALLRFGTGPVVELTVYADTADAGAEAEFRRLLDSARPAATADPIAGVARAIAAGPPGRPDYPAGAVRLALTPDYHGPTAFTLVSATTRCGTGSRRPPRLRRPPSRLRSARSSVPGSGSPPRRTAARSVTKPAHGRGCPRAVGPRPRRPRWWPPRSAGHPAYPRLRGRSSKGSSAVSGPGPRLRPRGHCPARGPR